MWRVGRGAGTDGLQLGANITDVYFSPLSIKYFTPLQICNNLSNKSSHNSLNWKISIIMVNLILPYFSNVSEMSQNVDRSYI